MNSYCIDILLNIQAPVKKSQLGDLVQFMFMEIKKHTEVDYEMGLLRQLFPKFQKQLEFFDVLSYDIDGSLYSSLSTPNVKLYYPEPFIATPSFMHEDI
jgi:hypothetical protein